VISRILLEDEGDQNNEETPPSCAINLDASQLSSETLVRREMHPSADPASKISPNS